MVITSEIIIIEHNFLPKFGLSIRISIRFPAQIFIFDQNIFVFINLIISYLAKSCDKFDYQQPVYSFFPTIFFTRTISSW